MLCSMKGTEISKVEGLWLFNKPKHSVSEDQDDNLKVQVCSLFIVPSLNSMRDPCDIILWHHNCLLWSSGRKTTMHVHWKHHHSSVHLLASTADSPNTINASKPLHLFLNPNYVPVTLSPRYFSVPLYWSLNLFTHFQQNTGRYNKQTRMMDATCWLKYVKNKIWWGNAQLTSSTKYLHARHTIHEGRKHRPAQTWLTTMAHHLSLLSVY